MREITITLTEDQILFSYVAMLVFIAGLVAYLSVCDLFKKRIR